MSVFRLPLTINSMLAHYGIYAEIALVTEAILLQKLKVKGTESLASRDG
ncbi:hypothetical protein [Saccharolobus islandicus]|nr:hypothetical protein [Sulfolobus islandicus]